MASRNSSKEVEELFGDDEPLPEIPEEFGGSVEDDTAESTGLSLDDLEGMTFDDDAMEEARKYAMVPNAKWQKKARFDFKLSIDHEDRAAGDRDSHGRTLITITGKVEKQVINGIAYEPLCQLILSPDARYFHDENDNPDKSQPDRQTRLWLQVMDLHLNLKGQKTNSLKAIVKMLCEDEYEVSSYTRNDYVNWNRITKKQAQVRARR